MKRFLTIIFLSLFTLLMFTTTGCSGATKIGDILANTSQYEGKDLTIRGTVGETAWFAIVGKGAYQLGDSTGNIWIVTSQPTPQEGQTISAEGKIQSAFSIGTQSFGTVLAETKRN